MKKIFLILVVLLMMIGLSACGTEGSGKDEGIETNKNEGTGEIDLRLAWFGDGQNKDALDVSLQKYTEKTGVGIETIFIPGSWAEYFTKMQTMVAGGEDLDAAFVAIEGFEMFVDMGLGAPIDDWIAQNQETYDGVASDVSPHVLDFMKFNGKQYGIPMEWNNIVAHINTKLLEEANLEIPPKDWSIDLFLEYCEKLTVERADGTKQYAVSVPGYYFGMQAWLYSNGGSFMNEDFTASNLLAPETIEVFQLAQDLIHKYGYAPIGEKGVDDIQQLVDGNLAIGFWGRWPTTKYTSSGFRDVAIQYSPTFKETNTVWGGAGIFTMESSKNKNEATDLAIYIASAPFIKEFMASGAIPVLNSVAKEIIPALGYPKNNEIFFESADVAIPIQAPIQYAECEVIINTAMSEILTNNADILEVLTQADADLNQILSENK